MAAYNNTSASDWQLRRRGGKPNVVSLRMSCQSSSSAEEATMEEIESLIEDTVSDEYTSIWKASSSSSSCSTPGFRMQMTL
ncbi:unnamed protein product [Linum trigynum]|uniref:Uncharacterized protein n=1 Tax=Linum trigynum TaxID=586398 RepID=A0AAV2DAE4_9ROSI